MIFNVSDNFHDAEAIQPEVVLNVIRRTDRARGVDVFLENFGRGLEGFFVVRHFEGETSPLLAR